MYIVLILLRIILGPPGAGGARGGMWK